MYIYIEVIFQCDCCRSNKRRYKNDIKKHFCFAMDVFSGCYCIICLECKIKVNKKVFVFFPTEL